MKIQKISLNLEGKTDRDLELALEEAIKKIKEGYTSGSDSNDSGSYSLEVKREVRFIEDDDITEEAKHIATQFSAGDINADHLEQSLLGFAINPDGLDLDNFNEYIEGDIASMIQVMIDECGGVENHGDEDVVEKLNEYFEFTTPITTLRNAPAATPA